MYLLPASWSRARTRRSESRLALFRAVIESARAIPAYHPTLNAGNLHTRAQVRAVRHPEAALAAFPPLAAAQYRTMFSGRSTAWRQRPENSETRSALLVPYAEARAGIDLNHAACPHPEVYAAVHAGPVSGKSNHPDRAIAVFTGMDAGLLTCRQRDQLWWEFHLPVFEQFVGPDGRVAASECEVHSGLHVRPNSAILECVDGEILLTSLTDRECPAIRLRTGLSGSIDEQPCDCGREDPRVIGLSYLPRLEAIAAVA